MINKLVRCRFHTISNDASVRNGGHCEYSMCFWNNRIWRRSFSSSVKSFGDTNWEIIAVINTPDITPAVSHLILLIADLFDIIQSHSERQRSERIASIFEREKKRKKKQFFYFEGKLFWYCSGSCSKRPERPKKK